jgi:dihydrofolate reductase
MKLSVIYAQDANGAIGLAGAEPLPWNFSEDLQRFKELTQGKPIIMGNNTFESLPRVLPSRFHFVVTRKKRLIGLGKLDQVQFIGSVGEAVLAAEAMGAEEAFIIGGADIIRRGLDMADTVYRTIVKRVVVEGKTVKVPAPGEDAVWDEYERFLEVHVSDDLCFETWARM